MRTVLLSFVMLFGLIACDDGGDTGGDAGVGELSLVGTWVDPFATEHVISMTQWTQTLNGMTSVFDILTFDTDSKVIIAENAADNMFAPGKFSRFDWTQVDDRLFFCQSAFDKDTAEDAADSPSADPTDPTTGGCGGMFPWSELLMP